MSAIITDQFRILNANNFVESVENTNNSYYVLIGLPNPAVTGNFNNSNPGIATHLGRITWGRLYNASRNENPISIGVTGFTINTGLTTFPTIQRKNYTVGSLRGLRSSGAIRVFGI